MTSEWYASIEAAHPDFRKNWIRHRFNEGHLAKILQAGTTLEARDATFRIVSGLADSRAFSFVATNPNLGSFYLRHQGYRIKLHQSDGSDQFKQDATFIFTPPLAYEVAQEPAGCSLRSYQWPNYFIRHINRELWLGKTDASEQFKWDASFHVRPGLYPT
ncbi:AbfB domain-containing protein [Streptomyces narbonensis]|uniref:AbfB domain-containing protein n=1 Tax=Streptomyces narbonensis TaxID=67333 RepID=UPI0033E29969